MKGELYKSELMVIGRAVNGWTEGVNPKKLKSEDSRTEYADLVYNTVTSSDECPMGWITGCWGNKDGYNTKKSAFWRVIRSVVSELGISDVEQDTWSSHLVWSNLYKVAPAKGGNPNNTLCNIQFPSCSSLLEMELKYYNPKRVLFLTGVDWAEPFLENICSIVQNDTSHVVAVAQLKINSQKTKIVVATHPQGKPEEEWVSEVVTSFRK
jgi:hypothetical protein